MCVSSGLFTCRCVMMNIVSRRSSETLDCVRYSDVVNGIYDLFLLFTLSVYLICNGWFCNIVLADGWIDSLSAYLCGRMICSQDRSRGR